MSNLRIIQVESNKPFVWPKGLRLEALDQVTILLPGTLVQPDEQIGSIIEVSDEAEIALKAADDPNDRSIDIILRLRKGQSAELARSVQAIVLTMDGETISLRCSAP